MHTYKITFTTESGRSVVRRFCGESEGEAIEHFEYWAEGFDQILEFVNIVEVVSQGESPQRVTPPQLACLIAGFLGETNRK